jgi:hypothetical protein
MIPEFFHNFWKSFEVSLVMDKKFKGEKYIIKAKIVFAKHDLNKKKMVFFLQNWNGPNKVLKSYGSAQPYSLGLVGPGHKQEKKKTQIQFQTRFCKIGIKIYKIIVQAKF